MLSRINYNFIHWVDFLQIKLLLFTMVSSASSNAQFAIWVDVGMPPNLEMTETAKDILSFSLSNFLRENNIYYCSWLSINFIIANLAIEELSKMIYWNYFWACCSSADWPCCASFPVLPILPAPLNLPIDDIELRRELIIDLLRSPAKKFPSLSSSLRFALIPVTSLSSIYKDIQWMELSKTEKCVQTKFYMSFFPRIIPLK